MLTSQDFRRTATDRKFTNILRNRDLPKHDVKRIKNCDLKTSLLVTDGLLDQPLLVTDSPESIGMKMPPPSTSLQDIADIIGAETPIKLIEVGKQSEVSGHTLGEYAEYFAKRSADHKTLNLISLEFSATPLSTRVQSPKIVREIDWIDVVWPLDKRARGDYPKVQKYCLAGMQDSYTDFHIDFGGTSVWYHILWGQKRFYFAPPSTSNLKIFVEWSKRADQESTFLGDLLPPGQCFFVDLLAGQTLFIPSGWIHAVYTPVDSLVFGGNFLHSSAILRQLQVYVIEERTRVGKIYRFPYFKLINFTLLCSTLSLMKKMTAGSQDVNKRDGDINNEFDMDSDDDEDLKFLCDTASCKTVLRQYPFLLKACDLWLKNSSQAELDQFKAEADKCGHSNAAAVLEDWWAILFKLAQALDLSSGNEASHFEVEHIDRVKDSYMFDLLDDSVLGAGLPPPRTQPNPNLHPRPQINSATAAATAPPTTATAKVNSTLDLVAASAGPIMEDAPMAAARPLKFKLKIADERPEGTGNAKSDSENAITSAVVGSSSSGPTFKFTLKRKAVASPEQDLSAAPAARKKAAPKRVQKAKVAPTYIDEIEDEEEESTLVEFDNAAGPYSTRGKKLSASFLERNTDVEVGALDNGAVGLSTVTTLDEEEEYIDRDVDSIKDDDDYDDGEEEEEEEEDSDNYEDEDDDDDILPDEDEEREARRSAKKREIRIAGGAALAVVALTQSKQKQRRPKTADRKALFKLASSKIIGKK